MDRAGAERPREVGGEVTPPGRQGRPAPLARRDITRGRIKAGGFELTVPERVPKVVVYKPAGRTEDGSGWRERPAVEDVQR